jgi:hypothetical protein
MAQYVELRASVGEPEGNCEPPLGRAVVLGELGPGCVSPSHVLFGVGYGN